MAGEKTVGDITFRIRHTMMLVSNLERSMDFYTRLLGMDVQRLRPSPDKNERVGYVGYGTEDEYPGLELIETQVIEGKINFPYIPGLLSFRELPLLVSAFNKLSNKPDLILVDGQGLAHPRRLGIASHLGLFLDIPTIGCAKSRLCGTHKLLTSNKPGSYTQLIDNDEVIGVVLRTKSKSKPLYVSIGHKIDLPSSIHWVKKCLKGYRLPEPCRLAHLVASNKILDTAS